jgi:excinuclease ABC subunit A
MRQDQIVVSGAREHNLKDVSITLPRDALVVLTGLSGLGQVVAGVRHDLREGQRRYVESLSAYARQFLGQMDKPDVDSIEGLSPAISIDQKTTSRNPRSTVGTVTEIYDYLRLLWAAVGTPHCPECGGVIEGQSAEQIIDQVMAFDEGTRFMVLAPVVRGRKGEYGKLLEELRAEGYTRVKVDGDLRMLEEEIVLDKKFKHDISVVVDRLVMRPEVRKRLADSVETAVGLAAGSSRSRSSATRRRSRRSPSASRACRAAPRCPSSSRGSSRSTRRTARATGARPGLDDGDRPRAGRPRRLAVDRRGRARPVGDEHLGVLRAGHPGDRRALQGRPRDAVGRPVRRPSRAVPVRHQRRPHPGHVPQPVRPPRSYATQFEGIITNLERRYKETESELQREKIEEYMSMVPCPSCKGARLRPESRSVRVGGLGIHEFSALSVRKARTWLDEVELTDQQRRIARLILREIEERLRFLHDVGIGYLSMDRAAATLSGGEAQRIRLATQIGSALVGVSYVLDEPSIGLHQRDNTKLIGTLERLRDLGNTVWSSSTTSRRCSRPTTSSTSARAPASTAATSSPRARQQVMANPKSLTGQFLSGKRSIAVPTAAHADRPRRDPRRQAAQPQERRRADPAGTLTCVTGVSGSGKSTLVNEVLYKSLANRLHRARQRPGSHKGVKGLDQLDKIIQVDQSPIGRTPRSNPATYTGLFDVIRDLFAKTQEARARGYKPGASRSTSRAGAARSAAATARSRSRCTSCRTSTSRASSATASATTARRCRSASRARRSPTCSRCRSRRRSSSSSTSRRSAAGSRRSTTSAWATSGSASRRRRCRAARRSASSSPRALEGRDRPDDVHPRRADRPACTSPTSSGCSRCCTASSTRATRSWSSSTTST